MLVTLLPLNGLFAIAASSEDFDWGKEQWVL